MGFREFDSKSAQTDLILLDFSPSQVLYKTKCSLSNLQRGGASWNTLSKCACLAPDGAGSVLSGDLKYHAEKTKPTVIRV